MIASTIRREIKIDCICLYSLEEVVSNHHNYSDAVLVLLDSNELRCRIKWGELRLLRHNTLKELYFALFNVPSHNKIEIKALANGIRGVLYKTDAIEKIAAAIVAMMGGELWFSRKILSRYIIESSIAGDNFMGGVTSLTEREIEILSQLATGASNKDIANCLCISHHTVKTHIYNIFKKINVENRLQASIWVGKNMGN
jgi:DNA-binding NarL/FixJ family response regulator